MQESYGVAAFRSRQHVMRMAESQKAAGVSTRVVATPREICAGCGLSLRFDLKDASAVRSSLSRVNSQNLIGLYRVQTDATNKSRLSVLSR